MNANDFGRTYDCKVGGCVQIARANRGRYAYLCEEHRVEAAAGRLITSTLELRPVLVAGQRLARAIIELRDAGEEWSRALQELVA